MITAKYVSTKLPAAPVVNVSLSAPGERVKTIESPALIDTGGDFTTAPVDLHIANEVLPGVEVVGISEEDIELAQDREIILGRNVLNTLILLLNGPQQQCAILDRAPLRF